MKLILVRHGETEDNAANIVQGQTHGRLSANGRSQAKLAALRLEGTKIDAVYTSDLERARVTAEAIAARLPVLTRKEDARLREQDFGVFEGQPIIELLDKMDHENADFATFAPSGGETRVEFQKRVLQFFDETRARHVGETVLIVTHYGVINIFLGWLLNHADPLSTDLRIANGSVTILDIDENGRGKPHILNDVEHLDVDNLTSFEPKLPRIDG
ncbi:MAG TPA: histidine phosphatase family protein [Actinobacteria bacterium]|nr:histidine phosphatase family protein [Actinomycetota bacterium]